jgi:glycosyltransferase involved in cell wall biosynthesis
MMTEKVPKVSILLPSFNARKFLEPRVDSLLRQTFGDWEAIVLDSQSTDGTWEYFQSIAQGDSRFRLIQVPREGVYAALNRGLELAAGEFVHVATCDDTMAPTFLSEMIQALDRRSEAGVAVCDCLFINRDGDELQSKDMTAQLAPRQIRNLLRSGTVRASLPLIKLRHINYRPPPHDCLLHFNGRSVYFSLTQLLIRTEAAKSAGVFETELSSAADFRWLVRLTSLTGSIHLPKRLATWRFHGDQVSLRRDKTRLRDMAKVCENILPAIRQRYPGLLTDTDCNSLLLPYKITSAPSAIQRVGYWLKGLAYLCRMLVRHPLMTLRILFRSMFRTKIVRNFLIASVLQRKKLAPRDLDTVS